MRENWIPNRVFTSYKDMLDHCCDAWNRLADQTWTIMSIGLRARAYGSCQGLELLQSRYVMLSSWQAYNKIAEVYAGSFSANFNHLYILYVEVSEQQSSPPHTCSCTLCKSIEISFLK